MENPTPEIGAEVQCVRCGYSLRGLGDENACPECGLSIERSLVLGQRLADSRPGWIRSLGWAAAILLVAQIIWLVAGTAEEWVPEIEEALSPEWQAAFQGYEMVPMQGGLLLGAALHFIGCWMLTRPENPHAAVRPSARLGLILRLCAAGPLLASAMWLASTLLGRAYRNTLFVPQWVELLEGWAVYPPFLFLICPLLQFTLLRRLAARVLNRHLLSHTTIVGVGYPLSVVLLPSLVLLMSFDNRLEIQDSTAGILLMLAVATSFLLFWIWSMYAFLLCAIAFWKAGNQAEKAWRAADRSW